MHRSSALFVATFIALAATGCMGKTKYKDSPEVLKERDDCKTALKEKTDYIATLEKRLAELEGQGGVVMVSISGEVMNVTLSRPANANPPRWAPSQSPGLMTLSFLHQFTI